MVSLEHTKKHFYQPEDSKENLLEILLELRVKT